jgi:hypothetical protein
MVGFMLVETALFGWTGGGFFGFLFSRPGTPEAGEAEGCGHGGVLGDFVVVGVVVEVLVGKVDLIWVGGVHVEPWLFKDVNKVVKMVR